MLDPLMLPLRQLAGRIEWGRDQGQRPEAETRGTDQWHRPVAEAKSKYKGQKLILSGHAHEAHDSRVY